MRHMRMLILFFYFFATAIYAKNVTVDLHLNYKTVHFAGKSVRALALNDQIPGPTLHFHEGDHVTINVYNHIADGTAIHWHGILLPWQMDGVAHVTQAPIPQGGVFHYHFTLHQSGTYWYHAHADLQEQEGAYGALIITPRAPEPYKYNKDFVIFLSDWINTPADQVYKNLKKDGDYYSPRFPIQPSLANYLRTYQHASASERQQLTNAYSMMQSMRMSPYDFSDVAYDTFLLNGKTHHQPWTAQVHVGDTVRLRFIDGGGSTQFHLKILGSRMQVVHVQGNNVKPFWTDQLYLTPGETWDVLIKIKKNQPTIIYAESSDKLGKVIGALLTQPKQAINNLTIDPFPMPQPVMMMHDTSMSMPSTMHSMHAHTMSNMTMPTMQMAPSKYATLVSPYKTNDPNKPVTVIHMKLSGWMGRYDWFLNDKPEYAAKPILIIPGKRYRFIFHNNTMMHHPMHLHGHWLILRNGHGAYDPKLHTIDVGPNETLTADFDADAQSGFWYFHCHNLFHMKSGMARLVNYRGTHIPNTLMPTHMSSPDHPTAFTAHPAKWYAATHLDLGINPFDQLYQMTLNSLFGPDFNKLQLHIEDATLKKGTAENADIDIFYWHLLDEFWAIKGGLNYFVRPADQPYWQPGIGIEGLMPYFIETNMRIYQRANSTKFDLILGRDTQLLNNLFFKTEIREIVATHTVLKDEIGSGMNEFEFTLRPFYRFAPGWAIFAEYQYQTYQGNTRKLIQKNGEDAQENSMTLGLSVIF